jgi:hypothetical protein
MKSDDIRIYEESLCKYTEIMRTSGKNYSVSYILECISVFEKLEDYDKCKDLLDIIRSKNYNKLDEGK